MLCIIEHEHQMKGYGPKMTCCVKLSQGCTSEGPWTNESCCSRTIRQKERGYLFLRIQRQLEQSGSFKTQSVILAKVHAILTNACFDTFKHHLIALLDQFIP